MNETPQPAPETTPPNRPLPPGFNPPAPPEVRQRARNLWLEGVPIREVARRLGLSPSCIAHWKRRQRWPETAAAPPATVPANDTLDGADVGTVSLSSVRARSGLIECLERLVVELRGNPRGEDLERVVAQSQVAERLSRVGTAACGWGQSEVERPLVVVGMTSQLVRGMRENQAQLPSAVATAGEQSGPDDGV